MILDALGNPYLVQYDAVKSKGRRQPPSVRILDEDKALVQRYRHRLTATTQNLRRNYSIAAWAIRQHLNYVSSFTFEASTGKPAVNERLKKFVKWWSKKENLDAGRRLRLGQYLRIIEASRTIDGDFACYRLADGRIQGLEGDHIASPTEGVPPGMFDVEAFINGVKINKPSYEPVEYCICDRVYYGIGRIFRQVLPARLVSMVGYYDRYDQIRGVSPLSSAVNQLEDTYEGIEYALMKMKVTQLFALALFRDAQEPIAPLSKDQPSGTYPSENANPVQSDQEINLNLGPQVLDMNKDEKAEFLESHTPARETQDFLNLIVQIALKALDIPFSFFNEAFTNFYGSRGAGMQYIKSCQSKREDLQALLNELLMWRLKIAQDDGQTIDGELVVPPDMPLDEDMWEWVPSGVPWWDLSKEIDGYIKSINAGLDNPQRVARLLNGTDLRDNVDRIAEAMEYAKSKNVNLAFATTTRETIAGATDEGEPTAKPAGTDSNTTQE